MGISASVRYNSDNERTSITVDGKRSVGLNAKFTMDGPVARLTSVRPREGETDVFGDNLSYAMDYVEDLPFVEEVGIDEYEDSEI